MLGNAENHFTAIESPLHLPLQMADSQPTEQEQLQHLKQVSRIKHKILENYLPPWAVILGSVNRKLNYLDCFAGPGKYEFGGQVVMGSPAIAVSVAKKYLERYPNKRLEVGLIEEDPRQIESLRNALEEQKPFPSGLNVTPLLAESNEAVQVILERFQEFAPTFAMIDPYGHPLPIPVINKLLRKGQVEVLINVMWWRINMNLNNPYMQKNVDAMFGNSEWRHQSFARHMEGAERRQAFLNYFMSQLDAKHTFAFTIKYDPEDNIPGGDRRVKYWLVHASNNPKAVLLMKEVMYKLGDEQGTFEYSATIEAQNPLFEPNPLEDLRELLLNRFTGKTVSFDDVRIETYREPYIEKQYRAVIQELRKQGTVKVKPVTSKTERGLQEGDLITFP